MSSGKINKTCVVVCGRVIGVSDFCGESFVALASVHTFCFSF